MGIGFKVMLKVRLGSDEEHRKFDKEELRPWLQGAVKELLHGISESTDDLLIRSAIISEIISKSTVDLLLEDKNILEATKAYKASVPNNGQADILAALYYNLFVVLSKAR